MLRKLLHQDDERRITTHFEHDPYTGKSRILTEQDVEPLLDQNKARQTMGNGPAMDSEGAMWHAAHIPDAVILKWWLEDGIDVYNKGHIAAVKRKLDDSEWRHLRTNVFRLGTGDK
jgi:hypothetical protein